MEVFILLDRTGSMAGLWTEAVRSVNAYVKDLQANPDDRVTLAVFDLHDGLNFDVVRDAVKVGEWKDLGETEVTPRGSTPLFDSLARIIGLAEGRNGEKTVLVVMTDGHENASREVTRAGAKAAVERFQARGWQVVFLGANFDAFDQAAQVGVSASATMSATPDSLPVAMSSVSRLTASYRATGARMSYTDDDRKRAKEDKVTKKS